MYSLKRRYKAFPVGYALLELCGEPREPRWRSDGRIERYLKSRRDETAISRDPEPALAEEELHCRQHLAQAWRNELKDFETLIANSRKRFRQRPDLVEVFRRVHRTVEDQSPLEDARGWHREFLEISDFVEAVEFSDEYLVRVLSKSDALREFIKDFDKTEGDYTRRKYAVRGFWVAVIAIILSSAFDIIVNASKL